MTRTLLTAVAKSITTVLMQYGDNQPACSKSDAYRQYGRSNVDRWIREGLILPATSGKNSKKMIDRDQLARVAAASNRRTYLPVAER
ncbi:hypothetical protein ACCC92_03025 [Mucilaginibacter sp. Mucisp84]|uniref:hypothetical protein n=1 Tax=Mucilaginibacter sp. Mucisp84 TaxID=3243058 RepID=UPI0039A43047